MIGHKRPFLALAMATLVLLSGAGVGTVSADAGGFDPATADAPNPTLTADVTKASHDMGWAVTEYEDDNGDLATLDAALNESDDIDNPFSYYPTRVNDSEYGEFPRKDDETGDNTASALDASEWSKTGGESAKGSISDVNTASGVDAVRLKTDGSMSAGNTVGFEYSNFSITADEGKRYLRIGADVNTLDSGTTVDVTVNDTDGDYKVIKASSNENHNQSDVWFNATGDSKVSQQKLADLTTQTVSGSDGTFDDIEKIDVNVTDGDAEMDIAILDVESKSELDLGTKLEDTDDDDDLEETELTEPQGQISIDTLDTMDSGFDDAEIQDLTVPMNFSAAQLPTDDAQEFNSSVDAADQYPNYDKRATVYYRLELPSAIDLSYANADLNTETALPDERYVTFEYVEGASDTDFGDLSGWSDISDKLGSPGDHVTLDSSIQAGQTYALQYDLLYTTAEWEALQQSAGGGVVAQDDGFLGGFLGNPLTWVGGAVGALVARVRGWI